MLNYIYRVATYKPCQFSIFFNLIEDVHPGLVASRHVTNDVRILLKCSLLGKRKYIYMYMGHVTIVLFFIAIFVPKTVMVFL